MNKLARVLSAAVASVALIAALGSLAFAGAPYSVMGTDYYGSVEGGQPIDVLEVKGNPGDTVYVDVKLDNGTYLARDYEWTLPNDAGSKAGMLQMSVQGLQNVDSYRLEVFSDKNETNSLGEWKLQGIQARLIGAEGMEIATIGARSLNVDGSEDMRGIVYPAVITKDGKAYAHQGDQIYREVEGSNAITGRVVYVDEDGQVLHDFTQTYENAITPGTSVTAPINKLQSFKESPDDVVLYRAMTNASEVTLTWAKPEVTIKCKAFEASDVNGCFVAKIHYQTTDGEELMTDTVSVYQKNIYTAPDTFYTRAANEDGLFIVNAYDRVGEAAILMDPAASEGVGEDGVKHFYVSYVAHVATDPQEFTVYLADGTQLDSSNPSGHKLLDTDVVTVNPGESYSYDPTLRQFDGMKVFDSSPVMLEYGQIPVAVVYYVPEDYVPRESYDVALQYVNVATGNVIGSQVATVSPDAAQGVTIGPAPATFESDDATWVRLDGQSAGIKHGYFSNYRTYTVYYRDSADERSKDYKVVDVVAGNTSNAAGETATVGLTKGSRLVSVTARTGEGVLANPDGVTTQEEREIADNRTPLAAPKTTNTIGMSIPAVAGALAVLALLGVIAFWTRKRRG